MPKYTCEFCLKEFSQKSHYTKHQNKKLPCQDNKGKIEEVVENIIINKKLILNNNENIIINTMSTKQSSTDINFEKMKMKEIKSFCKEHKIRGYSNKNKGELISLIVNHQKALTTEQKLSDNILNLETNNADTFTIGTLFTGIGSIEHALYRLNINHKIVFACDICKYVKESYFANYKINQDDWYSDVNNVNGNKYKNVDMIVGGSPCQSFSFVGKQKGLEDDRGNLIFQFIRVINEAQPKMFIFENVKGLTTHENGKTFDFVKKKFYDLNYDIQYSILNGKDYGIPQSRNRLFMVGINKNSNIKLNIFPPPKIELLIKMKDLLEDNVENKYYLQEKGVSFVTNEKNIKKKYTQINGDIALCQKKNQQFNWHGDFIKEYREIPSKYYLSEKLKNYVLSSGTKNFKTSTETDLDIARPLLSSMHKMHRAGVDNYITYEEKIRKLTPRECLRLMGFTDDYKIVVSDTRMYQQAGNSIIVNIFIEIIKQIDYIMKFKKDD
jgi:DNA (cytosine-5)-methyltransferase 1